jgi:putative sterol carrier protein
MAMSSAPREYLIELDRHLRSDPTRTEGLTAVYQFSLSGEHGGSWWIEACDGIGEVQEGIRDDVNATIRMTDEVFMQMSGGELDGAEAYMDGLFVVEGDQSKAMNLAQIFGE